MNIIHIPVLTVILPLVLSLEFGQPHVCESTIEKTATRTESYRHAYKVKTYTTCFAFIPKCTKWVTRYAMRYRNVADTWSEKVAVCCPGYVDTDGKCEPNCSELNGCSEHGTCIAPNLCDCQHGRKGDSCSEECSEGTWGYNCRNTCLCQNGGLCDKQTGNCTCLEGWTGPLCHLPKCSGPQCQLCNCPQNATCDKATGMCHCLAGLTGPSCQNVCPRNTYGQDCQKSCKCENNAVCNPVDGSCDCSATAGWVGTFCNRPCPNGTYGIQCASTCKTCYNNGTCNHVTGHCICLPGYHGNQCQLSCPNGFYGINCSFVCNCNNNASCSAVDGKCQCLSGYRGAQCEDKIIIEVTTDSEAPYIILPSIVPAASSSRIQQSQPLSSVQIIAIVVSMLLLFFIIIFVVIIYYRKKLRRKHDSAAEGSVFYAPVASEASSPTRDQFDNLTYGVGNDNANAAGGSVASGQVPETEFMTKDKLQEESCSSTWAASHYTREPSPEKMGLLSAKNIESEYLTPCGIKQRPLPKEPIDRSDTHSEYDSVDEDDDNATNDLCGMSTENVYAEISEVTE